MTIGIVVNKENLSIISLMVILFFINLSSYLCITAVVPLAYLFFNVYVSNLKMKTTLYLYLSTLLFQLINTIVQLNNFNNDVFQIIATIFLLTAIFFTYRDRFFFMEAMKQYFINKYNPTNKKDSN